MGVARTSGRKVGVTAEGFEFWKVVGNTGAERYLLTATMRTPYFNDLTSDRLATEAGLRLVDSEREIVLLSSDTELVSVLTDKGKISTRFYAQEKNLDVVEFQHVENGALVSGKGNIDSTVRNQNGQSTVSLSVVSGEYAEFFGWRFVRSALPRTSGDEGAPVVYAERAPVNVRRAANPSKQFESALRDIARSLGPAQEVVERIARSGIVIPEVIDKEGVTALQALVRDAKALYEIS